MKTIQCVARNLQSGTCFKKINKSNLCFSFPVLNVIAVEEKLLAPSIMRIFCHFITLSVALPKSSRRSSVSESFFSSSLHTAGAFFVPFSEMVGVFSPFAEVDFGFLWIKGHFKMDKLNYKQYLKTCMSSCKTHWRGWSIAVQYHRT